MRKSPFFLFVALSGLFIFSKCENTEPPVFTFKDHPQKDSTHGIVILSTDYLTWGDASSMMKAYASNPNALKTKDDSGHIKTLTALQLDADFVRSMLLDLSVRKIELYFAVNKADLAKPAKDQTFTIVSAPVYFDLTKRDLTVKKYRDAAGNRTAVSNSELIDFCDPCPKNCPDTTQ